MTIWQLILVIAVLLAAAGEFIWLVLQLNKKTETKAEKAANHPGEAAEEDVEHIFNETFREELRNRGRLHFEKIIGENAMFLQQDLRLTTTDLNEYMKKEITSKLKEEFDKYEQSITDAKQMAIDSIQKTNQAIEEERNELSTRLQQEVDAEKVRQIERFNNNMADVVNHYLVAAIGNQIDLNDQLEYILNNFEANKQAIIEDLQSGT
jgi:biopolymer transport protein ExbB/TolQ